MWHSGFSFYKSDHIVVVLWVAGGLEKVRSLARTPLKVDDFYCEKGRFLLPGVPKKKTWLEANLTRHESEDTIRAGSQWIEWNPTRPTTDPALKDT